MLFLIVPLLHTSSGEVEAGEGGEGEGGAGEEGGGGGGDPGRLGASAICLMVSVGLCGISFNLPPSLSISFPPCRRRRSRKKNSASRAKLPNKPLDFQVIPRPARMPLPVLSRGFFPGHWRDSKPDKYKCTGHDPRPYRVMTHDLIQNQLNVWD